MNKKKYLVKIQKIRNFEVFIVTSMTGYSYHEVSTEKAVISVEFKSVNSRFLDLNINLPSFLNSLESYYRAKITKAVVRGKVDVSIRVRELESDTEIIADPSVAKSYLDAIKKIADATGYSSEIPLSLIISQPGVLNINKNFVIMIIMPFCA